MSNSFYCSLKYQEYKQEKAEKSSEEKEFQTKTGRNKLKNKNIYSDQNKRLSYSSLRKWFGNLR